MALIKFCLLIIFLYVFNVAYKSVIKFLFSISSSSSVQYGKLVDIKKSTKILIENKIWLQQYLEKKRSLK